MSTAATLDARPVDSVPRLIARGVGQLLLTAGVIILLFVAYELWWTGLKTRADQHHLLSQLKQQWSAPATTTSSAPPKLGSAIAILRIPRLGTHYKFAVVQGTSTADLQKGPGHYPDTAMPGQVGNVAIAGHRTTYLHPFYDIDKLKTGDSIYLETRTTWYTYRVGRIPGTSAKGTEIVQPTDVSVAYAVPDQPNASKSPTVRALTLTSCNPRYSATQRIVVHAVLAAKSPVSAGLPAGLAAS